MYLSMCTCLWSVSEYVHLSVKCIWVCALVCEVLAYAVVTEVLLWSTPRTLLFIKWSWVPMVLAGFDPYWIKQPASMENSEMVSIWNSTLITRFMGPSWGPSGADRTHMGPMLAPWTLLSGAIYYIKLCFISTWRKKHTRSVLQIIMKIGIHICIKTNIWNWLGYIFQLPISCTNIKRWRNFCEFELCIRFRLLWHQAFE